MDTPAVTKSCSRWCTLRALVCALVRAGGVEEEDGVLTAGVGEAGRKRSTATQNLTTAACSLGGGEELDGAVA